MTAHHARDLDRGLYDRATAFEAADNPIDGEFRADLAKMIERSEAELAKVAERARDGRSENVAVRVRHDANFGTRARHRLTDTVARRSTMSTVNTPGSSLSILLTTRRFGSPPRSITLPGGPVGPGEPDVAEPRRRASTARVRHRVVPLRGRR
jgi:hypothetical protein